MVRKSPMQIGRVLKKDLACRGKRGYLHGLHLRARVPCESWVTSKRPPADNSQRARVATSHEQRGTNHHNWCPAACVFAGHHRDIPRAIFINVTAREFTGSWFKTGKLLF